MAQVVNDLPAIQETWVESLDHPSFRVGKIPWRRKWQPTAVFYLENPIDRGAWWATVHGFTELDMTEQLTHTHTLFTKHILRHSAKVFLI